MSADKKRASGPSGKSLTPAERRAKGRVLVQVWLSPEAARALAFLTLNGEMSKTQAIENALLVAADL